MWWERPLLYFPSKRHLGAPSDVGLRFEDIRFGPNQHRHGWFIPGSTDLTLLWFHGNAGNISHRLSWLKRFHDRLGCHIFIFDYSGYGLSRGTPDERTLYHDARAALAYLRGRSDVDRRRIIYFGKSLGGAVAVDLAAREPPHRLIAQSTFTSLRAMARWHYPWLPTDWLVQSRYASLAKIGKVAAPTLIVHGDADDVVPVGEGQALFTAAREPKRRLIVAGAGHNNVIDLGAERYFAELREFIVGR